jgi:hypothetical protein
VKTVLHWYLASNVHCFDIWVMLMYIIYEPCSNTAACDSKGMAFKQ